MGKFYRAVVFLGDSGLGAARYFLEHISKLELAEALHKMFYDLMLETDN